MRFMNFIFRQFLLYTVPPVLHAIIPPRQMIFIMQRV